MTLTELLPINESLWQGAKTLSVNARDLHRALEIGRDFSTWIKDRLAQADFVENQDFKIVETLSSPKRGSANIQQSPKARQQKRIDYWLSLDTAKHICLMDGDRPLAQTVVNYLTETQKQNVKEMMTPETTKALVFPHKFHNDLSAMTTSLFVAEFFGKRHDNILQAIKNLDCSDEFRRLNFQESQNLVYLVAIGASRAKWLRLNNLPADDEIRQHLTAEQISLIDLLQSENAVMIKLKMDYTTRKNQLKDSALHYWQTHHRKAA